MQDLIRLKDELPALLAGPPVKKETFVPKFYSELQEASIENLSSDPSGTVAGRIWHNTTSTQIKTNDGTNVRSLIRNDQKAVFGNNGTANNNIRIHRGASGVLQFLTGGDTTAEGTLSTSLNQTSSRQENYTDSTKPAAGNAGRIVWLTDLVSAVIDNGTSYQPLGGGGGGGSLIWVEAASSPIPDTENSARVYLYQSGLSQDLFTYIKVPTSYLAGRAIVLKLPYYSPDVAGNVLLSAQSTLLRPASTAFTSTTNQRTTTNTAATLSATANRVESVSLDITSTTGTINSVAVAAGDIIKVRLFRGSDTATSDVRALVNMCEATFS